MAERLAASILSRDEIIKHWLLNTAVECPTGLNRIFPLPNTLSLNTRAVPNANAKDYSRNLLDLLDSEMIIFSSGFPEDDVTTHNGVAGILDRFLALPRDYERVLYMRPGDRASIQVDQSALLQADFKLTALGGEAWEKVAGPEWGRFIAAYTTSPAYGEAGPWEGELFSPNRDLMLAWTGWYPEIRHEKILTENIKWGSHSDFEVLYWKRLSFVHRATFHVESSEERWDSYKVPQWFWDWWTHSLHWHKQPWELPGWPSG